MQIEANANMSKQALNTVVAGERYVLMTLDHTKLLLPQNAIRILSSMADVTHECPPTNGIGWIDFQERRWPVYGLTDNLVPGNKAPATWRICALLNADDGYIGFACSSVAFIDRDLPPHTACSYPDDFVPFANRRLG